MSKAIRLATELDSAALLKIYAPFIKSTTISFEYEVPTVMDFAQRISATLNKYPWLVCEIDGCIIGYAYASQFNKRAAYDWSVDFSVYIDPEYQRRNIARALYYGIAQVLKLQGYHNAYAIVTLPNPKSESFHQSFGFKPVGIYHNAGYKFDQWHSVKWYEYTIMDHLTPTMPKSISEISELIEYDLILRKAEEMIL
jgi:phosphinothricin acetyltransferase